MKKIFLSIAVLFIAGAVLSAKELKVLMIGNSFSNSVMSFLPKMVKAGKTHKLYLVNAYIGGCTLQTHCKNIDLESSKPQLKPYTMRIAGKKATTKEKLTDIIKSCKWDIVTIQQGSRHSPYKELTHGYAKKLMAVVKKLSPQAEIVVHQTWAYRDDHNWFKGPKAKMDRQKMHEMVTANYTELAKNNKLRMIPVGNAVQLFRERRPVKPAVYDPADLKKLKRPAVLKTGDGDVVGRTYWERDRKTKQYVARMDKIHLNGPGQYLQGCVWYMFLFDADIKDLKAPFKHPDAKLARECAAAAIAAIKK